MLRVVRTSPLDDQIFSGDVGFGDEIDVALGCDLRDSETLDQQVAGVARDLSGEVKHVRSSPSPVAASFPRRFSKLPESAGPNSPTNDRRAFVDTRVGSSSQT